MKYSEIKVMSKAELLAKQKSLKEELFKLNKERFTGRVEKPHQFRVLRRDIARIETALNGNQSSDMPVGIQEKK